MIKTVQDLIDALSDFDPNTKVKIMYQPNYPLCNFISQVSTDSEGTVYICERSGPNDYAPYISDEI